MKLKILLSFAAVLAFAIYFTSSPTAAFSVGVPAIPQGVQTAGLLEVENPIAVILSNAGAYANGDEIRMEVSDDGFSTLAYQEDGIDATAGADDIAADELQSGVDYKLRMRSDNGCGESGFSSEYSFTTD